MSESSIYVWIVVAIGFLGLGFWVLTSKLEADAYFRITGKSVSTWDAMFIELRVQDKAKEAQ